MCWSLFNLVPAVLLIFDLLLALEICVEGPLGIWLIDHPTIFIYLDF